MCCCRSGHHQWRRITIGWYATCFRICATSRSIHRYSHCQRAIAIFGWCFLPSRNLSSSILKSKFFYPEIQILPPWNRSSSVLKFKYFRLKYWNIPSAECFFHKQYITKFTAVISNRSNFSKMISLFNNNIDAIIGKSSLKETMMRELYGNSIWLNKRKIFLSTNL